MFKRETQLFRPDTVKVLRTLAMNKVGLVNRREELRKKYPDEYVAINKNSVVGHNKDLNKLREDLQKKFGVIDHIAIEFISAQKVQLIL